MIVVKLQGGLGNQMFQYALGRALSLRKEAPFQVDISSYDSYKLRAYSLDRFSLKADFADRETVERLSKFKRKSGRDILSLAHNFFVARWNRYASEKRFDFDPDIYEISDDCYVDGFWNTEKYFKEVRGALLQDFQLRSALSGRNEDAARSIASSDSVSVHIRRGDYANDPETNKVFGTLDPSYYAQAFEILREKVTNPRLFVFSDDMEWVRKNIALPFEATYIDWNGAAPHEDMRLMSLCKHHVIANSTFSWWGAWLAQHPGKVVIGPERWFKGQKPTVDTRDVLPSDWIKI